METVTLITASTSLMLLSTWEQIPTAVIQHLMASLPRRVEARDFDQCTYHENTEAIFLWKSSKLKPQLHGSLKINHKSKLYEYQTRACTFSNKNRPLVCFYSKALHFRLLAHLVLS